jgi:transcriptional regulator with XRE-family HTH domain
MRGREREEIEPIGERLRRLRVQAGLSQRALAEPGVSYAYVSRIEAGSRQPSVKALRKLARKLGVSVEYLETGVDLAPREDRELRLREAELELRLSEDTKDAEQRLRELLDEAEQAGDAATAIDARRMLGLAALRRGEHAGAIAQLEQVVDSGAVSAAGQPEVYATLARAYTGGGHSQRAITLLERCLAEVEEISPDDAATYARFAIFLSYALSDFGELGRAREVLAEAIERASVITDPYMQVRLYWSQARLAAAEREPREALDNLRRAIALLESTEDRRQLGRAHLLYAEVLTYAGEANEAGPHLGLAVSLLGAHPDREDLYWLRREQARRAAELGDGDEAIARAREALDLIAGDDPYDEGMASWALAAGLSVNGQIDEAHGIFAEAVRLLTDQGAWREATEVARAWGRALRAAGRDADAAGVLDQAASLALRANRGGTRQRA